MSGKEMCNRKMIEEVNIGGTKNIIQACIKHNVKRLIYVSTYNVVVGLFKLFFFLIYIFLLF